jgi:hypothetical protein
MGVEPQVKSSLTATKKHKKHKRNLLATHTLANKKQGVTAWRFRKQLN